MVTNSDVVVSSNGNQCKYIVHRNMDKTFSKILKARNIKNLEAYSLEGEEHIKNVSN